MKTERMMVFALAVALVGFSASAQDAKKSDAKAAKDAKKAPPIAFVGGDIYTVTNGVIRNGTIVVENGKIARVGQDVEIPEGATRVDVAGKVITPGLVSINATNIAIRGGGGGGRGRGGPPGAEAPSGRVADSINPFDRNILFCLGSGITTACVEVGGGGGGRFGRNGEVPEDLLELLDILALDDTQLCPCCGLAISPTEPIGPTPQAERTARRHAVLKMTYGDMSPMLVKETPFYHIPAGSLTGALNRHQWREQVKRAKQQLKNSTSDDDGGAPGGPGSRRVPDEVLKVVEKKIPLRTEASSSEQMREMIALAKELDYDLILDGVHEGWIIPGELSAAKVQTILTPRSKRRPNPGKEDTSGSSIETSGSLEKAGVPFAVAPLGSSVSLDGLPGRDLTSLALEAAFAVRGGASEQTALAAVTITPAKMLGLGDRIGSIEEGKDADLLILDGPPLDYRTYVEKAYVGGKVYYDRSKDRIYPETPKR
jgi:imidazolonepropionase-like amidohydrolase